MWSRLDAANKSTKMLFNLEEYGNVMGGFMADRVYQIRKHSILPFMTCDIWGQQGRLPFDQ